MADIFFTRTFSPQTLHLVAGGRDGAGPVARLIARMNKTITMFFVLCPVQQQAPSAAGAGHADHLDFLGLGPFVQHLEQTIISHILYLVDQAGAVQLRAAGIQRPLPQTLRRFAGDKLPIIHRAH